jgi:hypothetical protein
MRGAAQGFGAPKPKREVVDVIEPARQDRSLDQLVSVRKQRLGRLERERNEARRAWRGQRETLAATRQRHDDHRKQMEDDWREARSAFLKMSTTSGDYRVAKAVYERMKKEVAAKYLACQVDLKSCREGKRLFFDALEAVTAANKQHEKLSILRDEIRAAIPRDDS